MDIQNIQTQVNLLEQKARDKNIQDQASLATYIKEIDNSVGTILNAIKNKLV